jgi:hypothetical protein
MLLIFVGLSFSRNPNIKAISVPCDRISRWQPLDECLDRYYSADLSCKSVKCPWTTCTALIPSNCISRIFQVHGIHIQPSLPLNGHPRSLPGIKRPRREADHSPPSSAKVTNQWHYIPLLLLHAFMVLTRKTFLPYNIHIQFNGVLQGLLRIRVGKSNL